MHFKRRGRLLHEDRRQRIARRALLLEGFQAAVLTSIGARMYQLQIMEADAFRLLAEESRINTRLVAPDRGRIWDRQGTVIAMSSPSYRITLTPESAGDIPEVLDRLALLLRLDPDDLERIRGAIARNPAFLRMDVANPVTWDQLALVTANAPVLPEFDAETFAMRTYPLDGDFVHQAGYVGPVSGSELEAQAVPDPLLALPGFPIGKTGIERALDLQLRGRATTRDLEVNAVGRVMRDPGGTDPTAGADVQLTLDHRLQRFIQARLAGNSAAAVVMDVTTGNLLGCVSAPSFDPNLFTRRISAED